MVLFFGQWPHVESVLKSRRGDALIVRFDVSRSVPTLVHILYLYYLLHVAEADGASEAMKTTTITNKKQDPLQTEMLLTGLRNSCNYKEMWPSAYFPAGTRFPPSICHCCCLRLDASDFSATSPRQPLLQLGTLSLGFSLILLLVHGCSVLFSFRLCRPRRISHDVFKVHPHHSSITRLKPLTCEVR